MKGFDWIFFAIMMPPFILSLYELYRTRKDNSRARG
jgi:hypothetical protein